jgi:hypothetical protein
VLRRPLASNDKDDLVSKDDRENSGGRRPGGARPWRAVVVAAALAVTALLAAACGGGGSHASGSGQPTAKQAAAFAQCMRGHGQTDFYPENPQDLSSTAPTLVLSGHYFTGASRSAQFQSAFAACEHLFPGAGTLPPPETKQQIDSQVKSAQCMHAHGFPSYPEPDVQNGRVLTQPLPSSIDTSSPQFQSAAKACNASV